ncbi:MAG: DUF1501 domain-containing protein [Fimbriiglobus sp.]|nr:DUF1501 domain-containing protein [Fimbriiglobus sp.]
MFGITDRRHFLKHAAAGAAVAVPGMSFLANLSAQAAEMKKKNKSLIVLWMGGGPTTIDLWDMKPDHPNGGGEAAPKPLSTSASGIQITSTMPTVAKQFKNLSIIRSLTTKEGDHNRGSYLMGTGRSPSPLSDFPHIGALLSYQYAQDAEAMKGMDLPGFISVGGLPGGAGPGFLGMKYANFTVQQPGQIPENIEAPGDVKEQMARRAALFDTLEGNDPKHKGLGLKTGVPADAVQAHKDVYKKALDLVVSNRKEVFSFTSSQDQKDLKDRYGDNGFGRGCLLARKLVEAGVACVQVSLGGWDMHNGIFPALGRTLPTLDKGMGSLVEDLAQSGKLKDTVIVWMGEFGRTPKLNANMGRDHYPRAWSVVVGGGNLKGGIAHGSTEADGGSPKDAPVQIQDLYATLYAGLGLDPKTQIRDNLGRPTAIAADDKGKEGVAIKELVG